MLPVRFPRLRPLLLAALALAAAGARAVAQPTEPLALARLTGPVTVDGVLDERAWEPVPALPLTMYAPVFRGAPTQRTEIRVAYDDEALYVAAWMWDQDPGNIRVNSLHRDLWSGDDALAIYLDAFNDDRNSKWFGVTAGGVRFDQLVSDDGATLNASWDTFWDARTRLADSGWFAEVRIPFSSIGFRTDARERAVMGLTVTRLVSRIEERVTFPEIDPRFDFRRPSVARDVVLHGVRGQRPLYLTPYALTRGSRAMVRDSADGFLAEREQAREVGFDVRFPLSGSLTLDLTVNTDFAQAESDDQQVNLDRFRLFYPERRRFFQEGSGVFDFVTSGGARLFDSRRIGLAEDATPVPILGGARLVGRVGAWDVGLLEMQTRAHGGTRAENFGVLRLRRPVLNPWSTAGLLVTSFTDGERANLALGSDGTLRLPGDHYLTLKSALTSSDTGHGGAPVRGMLHDVRWQRRTARGLAYSIAATRAERGYQPELGFMPRTNFSSVDLLANWYRFTDAHPVFRRVWPGALAFSTFRNADRTLESGQYAFWLQWETKGGGGGWIEPKWFREDVLDTFRLGGVARVPAGRYDFADLQIALSTRTGARARTGIDFRTGTYFDGTRTQVIVTPTWNVSRHLELGTHYQLSRIRFPSRGEGVDIQVARLRVRTALDARASANALVQWNSTSDRLDANFRLRYAFAEGTDLWIVYNEALDMDTERLPARDARSPFSLARTLVVKYSRTFGLRAR